MSNNRTNSTRLSDFGIPTVLIDYHHYIRLPQSVLHVNSSDLPISSSIERIQRYRIVDSNAQNVPFVRLATREHHHMQLLI